ncbi:MAG TPA: hypothetical protein VL086_11320 [Candidatus Nitrosotalea sp.]|nr:hypothetical protein [Candidatus Nitrosotalea sp.]
MAKTRTSPLRRLLTPAFLARGVLLVLLGAGLGVAGFQAIRFARSCMGIDGARAAIEAHVKDKHVRRMARVLKAADRGVLAARTAVRVTTLTCGPSLLGGMTCRARYLMNGQSVGMDSTDHYFRMGYSLLGGWQVASVSETSGLRYSLTPCRCSWGGADGR